DSKRRCCAGVVTSPVPCRVGRRACRFPQWIANAPPEPLEGERAKALASDNRCSFLFIERSLPYEHSAPRPHHRKVGLRCTAPSFGTGDLGSEHRGILPFAMLIQSLANSVTGCGSNRSCAGDDAPKGAGYAPTEIRGRARRGLHRAKPP